MLKHAMLCYIAQAGMKTYTVLSVNEFLRFQRNKLLQLRDIKTLNAVFLCHYYFSLFSIKHFVFIEQVERPY